MTFQKDPTLGLTFATNAKTTALQHPHIARVLFDEDQLHRRLVQLADEITTLYSGKTLHVIGVMLGGGPTWDFLTQHIGYSVNVVTDTIEVSSYGDETTSGDIQLIKLPKTSITGQEALLVEDIIDTGKTIRFCLGLLGEMSPRSLRVLSLLNKQKSDYVPDHNGFNIGDEFVVGFGLDYAQRYRNLPFVGTLKPEFQHI